MPKFTILQQRLVTQQGKATLEVPEGLSPIDYLVMQREKGEDPLEWEEIGESYLSVHVEPVIEPVADEPDEEEPAAE